MRHFLFILMLSAPCAAQLREPPAAFTIARLKYDGGGDWYNGPTEIPNLLAFIAQHTPIRTAEQEAQVALTDEHLFAYPVLFLTGHGNIRFSEEELRRLRLYLERGGFLFANDDYGLDKPFRKELQRAFPDKKLVPLPLSFGLFQTPFHFPNGLQKSTNTTAPPRRLWGCFTRAA